MLRGTLLPLACCLLLVPARGTEGPEKGPQRTPKVEEYEARAAFLLSLAKYTEWPDDASPAGEPLLIGVMGDGPMAGALEGLAPTFQGRKVLVKRFRTSAEVQPCHILYFPVAEERHLPGLQSRLAGRSVLTVGETSFFLGFGGSLHLFNEDGRLRFVLNRTSLEQAHLRVSAQVQRLAKSILPNP
jgi:hypothetical protein